MTDKKQEQIDKAARALSKALMDKGQIIGAGAAIYLLYHAKQDTPAPIKDMMVDAFMAGAQHFFGSLMGGLDPGLEPTPADERRMDLIAAELDAWANKKLAQMQSMPGTH